MRRHTVDEPRLLFRMQVHGFDASQLGTFSVTAAELPGGGGGRGSIADHTPPRGGQGGQPGWDDADCVPVRSAGACHHWQSVALAI